MKATVFQDESLREQAGRFVWLEIDTEKAQNAGFLDKFEVRAWPTYWVVDPRTEQVILKWVGGFTVPQFFTLLEDAGANFDRVRAGDSAGAGADANALLTQADLLYGEGKTADAITRYEEALAAAPNGWPQYARAVEGLMVTLVIDGDNARGVALARDALPRLSGKPAAVVAGVGLDCAVGLPDDEPDKAAHVQYFEEAVRAAVADDTLDIADDDLSGLHISLLSAREAAGDSTGTKQALENWSAFLETAAQRAATPEARTVFDSHRLSAFLGLDQPEKAIPMLEQSARDFPEDYNPHARLAVAYRAMERWDDALAAADRAVELGYGPRLLGILGTRADILVAKGDTTAARATLVDALARAATLPAGQRSERRIEGLRKKLEALGQS
jgi:tetratricopeptide (TPR) repeat protein